MIDENPVQIIVNGRAAITLMSHAKAVEELVFGALLTEKVIESIDEVESFLVEESGVSVVTKNPYSILLSRKTVLAGCGGASSFLDSGNLKKINRGLCVSEEQLMRAYQEVLESKWFAGGIFTSDGVMLESVEDISSQNVLDTLIGHCLLKRIVLLDCFVILQGNAVVETARKAIIAGISVLGVAGEVTSAASLAAKEAGLRIVML